MKKDIKSFLTLVLRYLLKIFLFLVLCMMALAVKYALVGDMKIDPVVSFCVGIVCIEVSYVIMKYIWPLK